MRIVQTAFFALVTVAALGFPSQAPAAFITSAGGVTAPSLTIDFSQFTSVIFGPGPVQIGGLVGRNVTLESGTTSSILHNDLYSLIGNGQWDTGRIGYSGTGTKEGVMTYRFLDTPVSQVGGFVNYAPGGFGPNSLIEALAQDGTVLESYDVFSLAPISTPAAVNAGAFRGITRATADIYAFRVSNSYIALDDLKFSDNPAPPSVATPLPGTVALAAFGFVGIALRRARR